MAFVPGNSPDQGANSDQDKQKNPLADQAPITSAPAGGGSGKPSGQATNKGPSQPFTNLSAYLTANGPQVQQMGADIAGKLNTDYNTTSGAIDAAKNSFNTGVSGGYTPYDQSLIDSFNSNPSSVASDPTKAAQFKGMYNDRYTGPSTFQDAPEYADLSGKVQKSNALADQVSSMGGLQAYLTSNSPTYTQGQATLDSALLKTNPDAVQQVTDATKQFANLTPQLNNAVTEGNAAAANANQQAQQAKSSAQGAASTFRNDFTKTQNDQFAGYAKQATDYNTLMNSATAKINNGDLASLTPEEQKLIGFNPAIIPLIQQYLNIFKTQAQNNPLNLSKGFTPGDQARMPTASDVFSPEELANYQALQSLTGDGGLLNFDAPTEGTEGSFHMPGKLPAYNNMDPLSQIQQSYGGMYDQLKNVGFSGVDPTQQKTLVDYMNQLYTAQTGGQPSSQPTTPPPAPGTGGDLGAGFHWDEGTGTWQPTIPLAPPGGPGGTVQDPGGGRHTF